MNQRTSDNSEFTAGISAREAEDKATGVTGTPFAALGALLKGGG